MEKLTNYIDKFIISEIQQRGFIHLGDDVVFITEEINDILKDLSTLNKPSRLDTKTERTKYLLRMIDFIKSDDKIVTDKNRRENVIIYLEYQLFLDENKYDNRYKKQVRERIKKYILDRNKNYKVLRDKYVYDPYLVELNFIDNLSNFITLISSLSEHLNIFYRGHSNLEWELIPSIYRNGWIRNEHKMFREIIIRNSEEFHNTKSTFEKLTIMQHYGLPTRLLDITKNPLVALFFACCDNNQVNQPGEVLVFTPDEENIKYFDSDTVSILSNISKAERDLETNMTLAKFNKKYGPGLKLLHLIKEEKPYFLNIINPEDFDKTLIVRPINNNSRIKKQSGYFFLFGINKNIETPSKINSIYRKQNIEIKFLIEESDKKSILIALEALGINNETLFPEIENGTNYIKSKYSFSID